MMISAFRFQFQCITWNVRKWTGGAFEWISSPLFAISFSHQKMKNTKTKKINDILANNLNSRTWRWWWWWYSRFCCRIYALSRENLFIALCTFRMGPLGHPPLRLSYLKACGCWLLLLRILLLLLFDECHQSCACIVCGIHNVVERCSCIKLKIDVSFPNNADCFAASVRHAERNEMKSSWLRLCCLRHRTILIFGYNFASIL